MLNRMKALHAILTVLFMILIVSCSPSAPIKETASIRIEAMRLNTASILPSVPHITNYKLSLNQGETTRISADSVDGNFSLDEVPVGTYTAVIDAYDGTSIIMTGNATFTVKPSDNNNITIPLNYKLSGTGILEVRISWDGLTAGNQVYEAINEHKSLGFRAVYANDGKPINGIMDPSDDNYISWADLSSNSFIYSVENIPSTGGTEIIFQIYTKIDGKITQLIAETFPSVMQIYENMTSKPDENEIQNFKLDANHIISYLENVVAIDAVPGDENPSSSLFITWTNPKTYEDENMPFHVRVTAVDNDNPEKSKYADSISYNSNGGNGSVLIEGLEANHAYNIYFQVFSNEGYSRNTALLFNKSPKIIAEDIQFTKIFNDSYIMGESILIEGKVLPEGADDRYTITIKKGSETIKTISASSTTPSDDRTYTLETSGIYTVTITSIDNPSISAEKEIKTKLSIPQDLSYVGSPDENGIKLRWDEVPSADGYKLIRITDGTNETEIDVKENLEYTDKDVASGHRYAYKIYAYHNDSSLNSNASSPTNEVKISTADITIQLPEGNLNLTGVLDKLKDKSITIGTDDSIEISLLKDIKTGAEYKWILNEKITLLSGNFAQASTLVIHADTEGLKYSAEELTPNSLMLTVTVNGKTESVTGYFNVINKNFAGSLIGIENESGNRIENTNDITVYYDSPIKLNAVFQNAEVEQPEIEWKSSNPSVMSVSQDGTVTTHQKGEAVTITVTVKDTQESKSVTLNPYVKATGISFTARDQNILIIEDIQNDSGVIVSDLGKSFNYGLKISKPNDSIDLSSSAVITTTDPNNEIIRIDEHGNITPTGLKTGDITITATIDGLSDSIKVTVLDLDIEVNNDGWETVTGKIVTLPGKVFSRNEYPIQIVHSQTSLDITNYIDFNWVFDNGKTSTSNAQDISGNGLTGTYRRGPDALRGTIKVGINYKDGQNLGSIGFISRSSNAG